MAKIDLRNIERRKKNRYSFYLNDEDKEIFLKKIEAEKTTIQKFLYNRIFEEKKINEYDIEVVYQIRKLGVVLNQYIKLIYDGKTIQDGKIIGALQEVKNLLENLKKEG